MKKTKIIASVICVLFVSILALGVILLPTSNKDESSVVSESSFEEPDTEDTAFSGDKLEYITKEEDTTVEAIKETTTTQTEETETTTESETTTTETTTETTTTSTVKEEITTTTTVSAAPTPAKKPVLTTTYKTEVVTTTTTTTEAKIVYKPSTHYFHMTSCKWFDNTCVFDYDINEIEGRICSKCNPDVTLVKEYKPPVTETTSSSSCTYSMSNLPCTQAEFYMLANLVAHEYGADWVSLHEKGKVVMTVMNRVRDSRFPNSIRAVILQRNQFCWVPDSYYWRRTTQSCKDAVLYYFNHRSSYSTSLNSFWGDGWVNHFYAA